MIFKYVEQIRASITPYQGALLWLISSWFAYRFILNGIRKFDPEGMWSPAFEEWGYPVWFRILIGILETGGGLILLLPKLRHWGGMVLFVVMLGALITRIVHGTGLDDALSISYFGIFMLYLVGKHEENQQP